MKLTIYKLLGGRMKNIWLLLFITGIAYVGFIGTILYECLKKVDGSIIKVIFCTICIVVLLVFDFPYIQDLTKQETTIITAEYVNYQPSNTRPGTRKLFFQTADGRISLLIPTVTRAVSELEPGKIYEIEFFNNCRVIKSYKLIG